MSRLMVDLFCGRGGWTKGFMQHGWQCRGYDWKPQSAYPAEFVQADILALTLSDIADADFICCSSPCEQFSVHCMKHFHKNPPFPTKGIELFERGRFLCGDKPHVIENVRCAERFVGRAVNHCGPFYLWGNAVPATFHGLHFAISKGISMGADKFKNIGAEERRVLRKKFAFLSTSSGSRARMELTAKAAEIPVSLSSYIAQCAANLTVSA